ncbi:MAG: putative membrane protein YdjX (TVP38/TMEM64 family) [Myxococcota bacterium]|jgi:uncharacterized membrane protein YdjX (TVP38/TMEM64 family)
MQPAPSESASVTASVRRRWLRPFLLVLATALIALTAHMTGLADNFDRESLRATISGAGVWAILLYCLLFTVGTLFFVPGIGLVFVTTAAYAWGDWPGVVIAELGALCAVSVAFGIGRTVGGRFLVLLDRPFVRRILGWLDRDPAVGVFFIRLVFRLSPVASYLLASTQLRVRDHLLGSAIGLFPWMVLGVFVLDGLTS